MHSLPNDATRADAKACLFLYLAYGRIGRTFTGLDLPGYKCPCWSAVVSPSDEHTGRAGDNRGDHRADAARQLARGHLASA